MTGNELLLSCARSFPILLNLALEDFGGNEGSRKETGHEFYLGIPYFDDATVNTIMNLKNFSGSVEQQLRALVEKRKGGDHDLSPFFEMRLEQSGCIVAWPVASTPSKWKL